MPTSRYDTIFAGDLLKPKHDGATEFLSDFARMLQKERPLYPELALKKLGLQDASIEAQTLDKALALYRRRTEKECAITREDIDRIRQIVQDNYTNIGINPALCSNLTSLRRSLEKKDPQLVLGCGHKLSPEAAKRRATRVKAAMKLGAVQLTCPTEGCFYILQTQELVELLGKEYTEFSAFYNVRYG
jgi:hypothetical protein